MASEIVKIPKKFADACALIRDGKSDGIEKLRACKGLEHQKTAVLAECAYFDGDFSKGLSFDMEICPHWDEWHYSNIGTEHVAAMAFAARILGRKDEVVRFFAEQGARAMGDPEIPEHIQRARKNYYALQTEYIKTGVLPYFTEDETYRPPETSSSVDEIRSNIRKDGKKLDLDSDEGCFKVFRQCCSEGSLPDMLKLYERIAENDLSTMWHIKALSGCNYLGDEEKGLEIVLRMARQRLWLAAAVTQVRPMEFFCHPSVFPYLSDKAKLKQIMQAAYVE
ncbi:MAG: hypothetical protein LBJ76_04645 [Candidatus Accumulibacter sp.]|jgi:hypothetical protein|nr:hypothetical protein [Accumulibacter sp.]